MEESHSLPKGCKNTSLSRNINVINKMRNQSGFQAFETTGQPVRRAQELPQIESFIASAPG
jgi:hypothetical protein